MEEHGSRKGYMGLSEGPRQFYRFYSSALFGVLCRSTRSLRRIEQGGCSHDR